MRLTIPATILLSGLAWGQGRTELRATLGLAAFLDESLQHTLVAGGSFRYYLNRRLSLGPEFLYMRNSKADQDFEIAPTLAFDLTRPGTRVSPYLRDRAKTTLQLWPDGVVPLGQRLMTMQPE